MAQSKASRAVAREAGSLFNPEQRGDKKTKNLPFGRRDINRVIAGLSKSLKKEGVKLPMDADPVAAGITFKLLKVGLRDNDRDLEGYCPKCKAFHFVDILYPCPVHPEIDLQIKVPNEKLERNSIGCLTKLFDKLYPNLSSVSGEVSIHGTMMNVTSAIADVIVRYVPSEKREACLKEIDALIQAAQNASSEE